jgi:hypothetical protein
VFFSICISVVCKCKGVSSTYVMSSALAWAGSLEQVIVKNKTVILRNAVQYGGLADCGGNHNAIPGYVNSGVCRDQLEKLWKTSVEGLCCMGVVKTKY